MSRSDDTTILNNEINIVSSIYTDKPPSYDSEIAKEVKITDTSSPPSYASLFEQITTPVNEVNNQIRRAIENSDRSKTNRCCAICCGSIFGMIAILLGFFLPISMITIGVDSLKKCPLQPKIPVWLIIFGLTILSMFLFQISIKALLKAKIIESENLRIKSILTSFLSVLLMSCFIAGNIWVYQVFAKSDLNLYDITNPNHCDRMCFLMAFWCITSIWILITLFFSCCVCCCIFFIRLNRRSR